MTSNLWIRQILAVMRLEIRKSFWSKRGWWMYLLALAPAVIVGGHSFAVMIGQSRCTLSQDLLIYAGIFQFFYLRLGIFFGCVGIFATLIRGEFLERTFHYYLLTPIRREALIAGKFLAGTLAATVVFTFSVAVNYLMITRHSGPASEELYRSGVGLEQLFTYMGIAALACVGYGAVFMALGLLFRNPMIPAAVALVWEGINGFLPALLKKFSVIFYLRSLLPVDLPITGPASIFLIEGDPVSPWLAVPGLLLFAVLLLAYASVRARRLEINYSSD